MDITTIKLDQILECPFHLDIPKFNLRFRFHNVHFRKQKKRIVYFIEVNTVLVSEMDIVKF